MKKSRFSEHQIITILKSGEAGRTAKDVCREHGISSATFYAWKSKFGGMEASDIKRMRDLEHENALLKQMYVDLSLENRPLKDVIEKKLWSQAEKRDVVLFVHEEHGLSVSKTCTALRISRSMFLYKPTPRDGSLVITTLLELVERYPRYGFAKYFVVLRRAGNTWNHKRVYRIYRQLQLNMRRKGKGRLPSRAPVRLEAQTVVNGCWSVDFMGDALMHGQRAWRFQPWRPGICLGATCRMGFTTRDWPWVHSTRQAHAKLICGAVQPHLPRGGTELLCF